ncbi:MAG: caspase family protein [Clostridiales bacterium]|nr:caspase family protein [Clostridiales bacterium]
MKRLFIAILILCFMLPALADAPRYRALCAGMTVYEDGRVRLGGLNSIAGVADALTFSMDGEICFSSEIIFDMTQAELFDAIRRRFAYAGEDDVSLIYLTAHGGKDNDTVYIELAGGDRLTPAALESVTRDIPGRVILFIDCCFSGGFAEGPDASGWFMPSCFNSTKYLLLTSSSWDEESYRVTEGVLSEDTVSTAFARSVCEGMGWDMMQDRACDLLADFNRDGRVTLFELYAYARTRVGFYLYANPAHMQTVSLYPNPAHFILARRARAEELVISQ